MSDYLLESTHTPEQCLAELTSISEQDPRVFDTLEFACESGDHRAVAIVQADSESRALGLLPASVRSRTKVTKLSKFTPEEIRRAHEEPM